MIKLVLNRLVIALIIVCFFVNSFEAQNNIQKKLNVVFILADDLGWDIGESNKMASKYQDKVKELDALIETHLNDANVVISVPNPEFEVGKWHPEDVGVQKGGLRVAKKSLDNNYKVVKSNENSIKKN